VVVVLGVVAEIFLLANVRCLTMANGGNLLRISNFDETFCGATVV